jgi:hypothetical protein
VNSCSCHISLPLMGVHRLTALHLSLLQHSLTHPPRSFLTIRGQKKKTLTSCTLSATGRRKATKSSDPFADENENPAGPLSPTPSKPRPKPRPIKKAANGANSITAGDDNSEATAAHALVTLQNRNRANSPAINRNFHAAMGLPKDANLDPSSDEEDHEDNDNEVEDQLADDVEEIDELEDDFDDSSVLFVSSDLAITIDKSYTRPFPPNWLACSSQAPPV